MKTILGHLTASEKTAIKAILGANLQSGRVGRKNYFISSEGEIFTVKIAVMDRGLVPCPGSPLRLSTYTHKFTL